MTRDLVTDNLQPLFSDVEFETNAKCRCYTVSESCSKDPLLQLGFNKLILGGCVEF